jgi:hypothetical protein
LLCPAFDGTKDFDLPIIDPDTGVFGASGVEGTLGVVVSIAARSGEFGCFGALDPGFNDDPEGTFERTF